MQIKKINNDKLKIILDCNDLHEKNIDIDSFLSNPIESQNLFFEILDVAEEKYNFEIQNNKAIVEAISLDNNIFILTITKINTNTSTYINVPKIYYFETNNDFLNFYYLANKNNIIINKSNIYEFNNKFYFFLDEENMFLEDYLLEFSTPLHNYPLLKDIFIEYGNTIKT